jgi:hypothetical protein
MSLTLQVDARGRMVAATEDPSEQTLLTTYACDALDDLITVTQGGQTRSFTLFTEADRRNRRGTQMSRKMSSLPPFPWRYRWWLPFYANVRYYL